MFDQIFNILFASFVSVIVSLEWFADLLLVAIVNYAQCGLFAIAQHPRVCRENSLYTLFANDQLEANIYYAVITRHVQRNVNFSDFRGTLTSACLSPGRSIDTTYVCICMYTYRYIASSIYVLCTIARSRARLLSGKTIRTFTNPSRK